MNTPQGAHVVGAGCAGPLLAALLAQRGIAVTLFERRRDPRRGFREAGRSINLALAARGLRAIDRAGLRADIEDLLVPMRGRLIHAPDGMRTYLPYGRLPEEFIWSISRGELNERLLSAAERRGVSLRFGEKCTGVDFARGVLHTEDAAGAAHDWPYSPRSPLFASDGARSAVRKAMEEQGLSTLREEPLTHCYKELLLPAGPGGTYQMEREVLHIWPRGGYMLIALPNHDGSFTVTLFLEREGADPSFATLTNPAAVEALMRRDFADAAALIPDLAEQFFRNPTGAMSTLHVSEWQHPSGALLLGDAAHGIVPFHGQGMNCAFEDCSVIEDLLDQGLDWPALFTEYARRRPADSEAIARMAVANYEEMRNTVRDPTFQLQKSLSLELEGRHPDRFIPRYSMVMFHAEIPYSQAESRGVIQQRILDAAVRGCRSLSDIDYGALDAMIHAQLPALRSGADGSRT